MSASEDVPMDAKEPGLSMFTSGANSANKTEISRLETSAAADITSSRTAERSQLALAAGRRAIPTDNISRMVEELSTDDTSKPTPRLLVESEAMVDDGNQTRQDSRDASAPGMADDWHNMTDRTTGQGAQGDGEADLVYENGEEGGADCEDEGEGSEEDVENDGEPRVENPSEDIRADLEEVLGSDMGFKGTFSFRSSYDDAPNPFLRLDGYGHVGQPLNPTEAKAVIALCDQAPFDKGERTLIDTSVRDTWEMDASKVQFDNKAWKAFMSRTVREVCEVLGVDWEITKPRAHLYKLLLYETGSHFLPHQDTEKEPGMFATLVVLLPSTHSGGGVYVSHAGLSAVMDCSAGSLMQTSVLAWYTDVTHEVKAVTGGYRLALSYNLVHTANTLRPSLPSSHSVVAQLRHILLSWKQRTDATPLKIIYLLDHQYLQANLKGSALKGKDAHKVALLDILAQELGFRLALANLELHLAGAGDDHGGGWGKGGMGEVQAWNPTVGSVVDLDGRRIRSKLNYEKDAKENSHETIPKDLFEAVEEGTPDAEEYEGYQGNEAGSADQWYNRTLLLLWPNVHNVEIEYGQSEAFKIIRTAASDVPTSAEREATAYLLRAATSNRVPRTDVATTLSKAACRWNNFKLWRRVLEATSAMEQVGVLGLDELLEAFVCFGIPKVQPVVENTLAQEPDNAARLDFLHDLEQRFEGQSGHLMAGWLKEQRRTVIETLKKPKLGQENLLLRLAEESGGLPFLHDTIVPQLARVADSAFLLALGRLLWADRARYTTMHPTLATPLEPVVTDLCAAAIARLQMYTPEKEKSYHSWSDPKPSKTPLPDIMEILTTCYDLGSDTLAPSVLSRALDYTPLTAQYVKDLLVPMADELAVFCSRRRIALTTAPYAAAFKSIVRLWEEKVLGPKPRDWALSAEHLAKVKQTSCKCTSCQEVLSFLHSGRERSHTLRGIGSQTRKHVENTLRYTLHDIATCNLIDSRPQGLVFHKIESRLAVAEWKRLAERGMALLNSISRDRYVLECTLGDEYYRIVELATGQKVHRTIRTPADPDVVPSSSRAAKPAFGHPPRPDIPMEPPRPSTRRTPPVTPQKPPAKRRKAPADDEVIDLCTP